MKEALACCRIYCQENPLLNEIEQFVQPYLQDKANSEFLLETVKTHDSASFANNDLDDLRDSLEDTFGRLLESEQRRTVIKKNPRYAHELCQYPSEASLSYRIQALDLAFNNNLTLFKKNRHLTNEAETKQGLSSTPLYISSQTGK